MINNLKEILTQMKIRQSKAAKDLSISARNLSRYENCETEPPVGLAIRMAAYYQRTIEELFPVTEKGGSTV